MILANYNSQSCTKTWRNFFVKLGTFFLQKFGKLQNVIFGNVMLKQSRIQAFMAFHTQKWPGLRGFFSKNFPRAKGQTISKANYRLLYSPKKWTKCTQDNPQCISFVFWENWGDHKLLSRFIDLYMFCFLGDSLGRYIFELFARETNLKKKHFVCSSTVD